MKQIVKYTIFQKSRFLFGHALVLREVIHKKIKVCISSKEGGGGQTPNLNFW